MEYNPISLVLLRWKVKFFNDYLQQNENALLEITGSRESTLLRDIH